VSQSIQIAFVMINSAVFFRVVVPLFSPSLYADCLIIAAGFWIMAFLSFVIYYLPILLQKRADEV
jgi:uncharacterized protein involved in response to NO